MAYKFKNKHSIYTRLNLVSMALFGAFILIALSLLFASTNVKRNIDRIVVERMQQTLENAQLSRLVSLLNARLKIFQHQLYGDDELLQREGAFLQDMIRDIGRRTENNRLRVLLQQLDDNFADYRQQAQWINYLFHSRVELDDYIEQQIQILQEVLAEKIINATLVGGDIRYLDQLTPLISGLHESFLEIALQNAQADLSPGLNALREDQHIALEQLTQLRLRAATLTASEPPLDSLGRQLLDSIDYYRYLLDNYRQERGENDKLALLQRLQVSELLSQLIVVEKEAQRGVAEARRETRTTINTTVSLVLVFLLLLSVLFWWRHRTIFRRHIEAPMSLLVQRLKGFQKADQTTPIDLGREDEWLQVEEGFNAMLKALERNVEALKESEKSYREIFANATEGIFRSTLDGQFIDLNPAAVAMLGCDSVEEAKQHYGDLKNQLYHDPQAREQMLERLCAQGTILDFEVVMRRRNGELFWCSLNNHLIRDGQGRILYLEGTLNDISERKANQESLRQMQLYLKNIIDSMPSVLIGVDADTRVTLWNQKAEQESLLRSDQVKGLLMSQVCRLLDPDVYLPKLKETLRSCSASRMSGIESIKKAAGGSSRFFDVLIYPLTLAETSGAVIFMQEVSERKRLEEMMIRSEKMQSIGSLASGVAHEINNPLAVILQNVQVISRRLSFDLSKNNEVAEELGISVAAINEYIRQRGCDKMLQSIADAGQRAAKIVENMQSFSRKSGTAYPLNDLVDLVEKTLALAASDYDMRYHYAFQKCEIVREFSKVPAVHCEPSQIQQVVLNLLKNAAQALRGQTDVRRLVLRLFATDERHVCFQVEDNGPGMEAEVAQRIFDPFFTTQAVGQGPGLGLSIAYYLVHQNHQGELTVTSTPGQGSCFSLTLPLEQDGVID